MSVPSVSTRTAACTASSAVDEHLAERGSTISPSSSAVAPPVDSDGPHQRPRGRRPPTGRRHQALEEGVGHVDVGADLHHGVGGGPRPPSPPSTSPARNGLPAVAASSRRSRGPGRRRGGVRPAGRASRVEGSQLQQPDRAAGQLFDRPQLGRSGAGRPGDDSTPNSPARRPIARSAIEAGVVGPVGVVGPEGDGPSPARAGPWRWRRRRGPRRAATSGSSPCSVARGRRRSISSAVEERSATPGAARCRRASSRRLVLPIPASPTTWTTEPRPCLSLSAAPARSWSSLARPSGDATTPPYRSPWAERSKLCVPTNCVLVPYARLPPDPYVRPSRADDAEIDDRGPSVYHTGHRAVVAGGRHENDATITTERRPPRGRPADDAVPGRRRRLGPHRAGGLRPRPGRRRRRQLQPDPVELGDPTGRDSRGRATRSRKAARWGDRLYTVYAEQRASSPGEQAWAGVGWVQDDRTGAGLFVEHEGSTERSVRDQITASLAELQASRRMTIGRRRCAWSARHDREPAVHWCCAPSVGAVERLRPGVPVRVLATRDQEPVQEHGGT